MYQCPLTGYLHFYSWWGRSCAGWYYVSMPFNGLSSFLHISIQELRTVNESVSMPFNGLSSFLPTWTWIWEKKYHMVSMLFNGLSSFLLFPWAWGRVEVSCVSMLFNGLSSFLPCPSETPCLQGFEGYVFSKFFENVTKVLHFAIFLFLQNFTTTHTKTLYNIITNFWQISSYFFYFIHKKTTP